MRRLLIICLLISFVQASFCQNVIFPTGLTITGYGGPIEVGSTLQLQATPTPSNTTYNLYKWSSDKTSVATVDDNGLVSAVSDGTATITCLLTVSNPGYFAVPNEQTATCTVTVKKKAANVINFSDSEVKRICLKNWDSDNDQELSYEEAAVVTDIGRKFGNSAIISFNELVYFTGLTSIGEEAFRSCTNLYSITLPNNVTLIDAEAFRNCPNLTAITIPQNVNSIGRCPFSECTSLTSIVVDSRNTKYDSRDNCNAIIETASNTLVTGCDYTTIPSSVTSIGEEAFRNCIGMTSISIPNSVTSIGEYTFGNCTSLTSVTIPNQVTSISQCAFYYCTSLTSVTIPNSVTFIGFEAFCNCSSLTSITIPNSVTSIVNRAFEDCMNLTSVTVEIKTPLSIYANTFPNRANATLYVPYGCKAAYEKANYWKEFKEIRELDRQPSDFIRFASSEVKRLCVENWDTNNDKELSYEEAAAVTDIVEVFRENESITSFNELVNFTGLTSIGDMAFRGCGALTSVTIPSTVTSIGKGAFYECIGLICINVPNSVLSIGEYAFSKCSSLSSANIGSNVTSIQGNAFWGCSSLTSFTIPNSVTSIGDWAFNNCTGLTTITIPDSVTSMGMGAFDGCSALTSVTIGNSLTTLALQVFHECSSLTSVSISNSVTTINYLAFGRCSSLRSVTIPNSVTSIAHCAFGLSGLSSITIPNSVTVIGNDAFSGSSLTSITVESGNTKYDSRNNCNAIIETNTNKLINGCMNTVIPDDVIAIGKSAFYNCEGLTSVIIPNSVTSIEENAFSGCTNMISVLVKASTPPSIVSNTFTNRLKATLYVPKGSRDAYLAADYWKEFKEIVEKDFNINFADAEVKRICVENWDTDNDQELSFEEAAAVTDLQRVFYKNKDIKQFDELQYFTGLTILYNEFHECDSLQSVIIPKNVVTVGAYAFGWCKSLTNVELPEGLEMLGDFAFIGCEKLPQITIPKSVKTIYNWTFQNCNSFTSIEIPENVEYIGNSIVSSCKNLTSVTVNASNSHFDSRDNCNAIIETNTNTLVAACPTTTIPNTVKAIGDYAFNFCNRLTSIEIPNSVESIGYGAFNGDSLTSIRIPANVKFIGSRIFGYCDKLASIVVDGNNTHYDSRDNCNAIIETATNTLIAGSIKTVIPESVTSIAENAFYGCFSIKDVVLPPNITSIGANAFGLITLNSVTANMEVPAVIASENTFRQRQQTTLYVPKGSKGAYEDADFWKDFMKIEEIENYLLGDVNGNDEIDIGDAVSIVNHLMGKEVATFVEKAADTNKNGQIDIGDVVVIINYLIGTVNSFSR